MICSQERKKALAEAAPDDGDDKENAKLTSGKKRGRPAKAEAAAKKKAVASGSGKKFPYPQMRGLSIIQEESLVGNTCQSHFFFHCRRLCLRQHRGRLGGLCPGEKDLG
jgi:hypothetical protein